MKDRNFSFSSWQWLRSIGNSTLVKLTILIPLIGYFLIFNENVVRYLELSRFIIHPSGPPEDASMSSNISWRLLFIYYGLCFLGLGSAVYHFRCPIILKEFGSATDFINGSRSVLGDLMFDRYAFALKQNPEFKVNMDFLQKSLSEKLNAAASTQLQDQIARKISGFPSAYDPTVVAGSSTAPQQITVKTGATQDEKIYENYIRDVLDLYFRAENVADPDWRLAIFIMYCIGFLMLAVPSANVFWRVTVIAEKIIAN